MEYAHHDDNELLDAVAYRIQTAIQNKSGMEDMLGITKLVWALYPFTSDLRFMKDYAFTLSDGYLTVDFPKTKDELHMFNKEPGLYFKAGVDSKIKFHQTFPFNKTFPLKEVTSYKLMTRIYLGEETPNIAFSPEGHYGFPFIGPLRLVGKKFHPGEMHYVLFPLELETTSLKNLPSQMGLSFLKPDPDKPDYITIAKLDAVRLAMIIGSNPENAEFYLEEWFKDPRFPAYSEDSTVTVGDVTLTYPNDQRDLLALKDWKVDFTKALNVKINDDASMSPNTTSPTFSGEQIPAVKKIPQHLLLTQVNLLREHLGLPPVKAKWSVGGDIIDLEEES
ncbi:hypothetical protein HWC35_gp053 [Vibrio phage USC-1]|uniref:Uncharacterized protein n=2 Tax=Aphroditevirus USC1 TaxID=2846605 RepID=A0A514A2D1_9CAUD|nr:hypothetical protein HWC35_gp053 [Vibrio phage USC-1]QCW23281.1 hypothetical protein [Vibrio phage 5 TSL-2019]QDH47447.1 hypothetical protein [Vibrio phage USC-1]